MVTQLMIIVLRKTVIGVTGFEYALEHGSQRTT